MIRILVSGAEIDVGREQAAIELGGAGAVAIFTGLVRADGDVRELFLEHYPGATEAALERLARDAIERWSLTGAAIVHRVGTMRPGERIVFVGAAAPHRAAALEACAFLIDRLKTDAPFWKREARDGGPRWVDARDEDRRAADRWRVS
ncbi:molybdenum cofactor biosynthesis protein MoaE [uncultured Sphingomonas sp.]|uniref:molybdenum cofactor biosynthesis protein MoaE n=1 Tax=uncultured Sphingomonas sp. TaxID=158754 RepID=UPI0035C9E6D6